MLIFQKLAGWSSGCHFSLGLARGDPLLTGIPGSGFDPKTGLPFRMRHDLYFLVPYVPCMVRVHLPEAQASNVARCDQCSPLRRQEYPKSCRVIDPPCLEIPGMLPSSLPTTWLATGEAAGELPAASRADLGGRSSTVRCASGSLRHVSQEAFYCCDIS